MFKFTRAILVLLVLACVAFSQTQLSPTLVKPYPVTKKDLKWIQQDGDFSYELFIKQSIKLHDPYVDEYLKEILDKLQVYVPENFPKVNLSISVVRYPMIVGSAFSNGQIVMSMIAVCDADYEDSNAFILAHEIAHVVKRDSLAKNKVVNRLQAEQRKLDKKTNDRVKIKELQDKHRKILLELENNSQILADLLAIQIVMKAGYNPKYALDVLRTDSNMFASESDRQAHQVRVKKVAEEFEIWKQMLPNWRPTSTLRPERLARRCNANGFP